MQRAKVAMGFRSVKRVEVKAETTTPGEVRTTTDANGVRVSATRARRTLPKLEFIVEENGAILHGPQRGLYPYYPSNSNTAAYATGSPQAPHGDVGSVGDVGDVAEAEDSFYARRGSFGAAPPMKDCVLHDTRATTLAVKYDANVGKFVCGSSIERFSGHTGVCRVLGSKKYPIIPHALQIGDLLRIGSVGLVVCEMNRGSSDDDVEALTEDEYTYIKENYLSLPLQQTFHPTEGVGHGNVTVNNNNQDDEEEAEEEDAEAEGDVDDATRRRQPKLRAGETSDEGESEEDGVKQNDDEHDNQEEEEENNNNATSSQPPNKKTHRNKTKDAASLEKRFCYICYDTEEEPDENPLVAPCNCKGDTKYVHLECLQRWNNNLDADGTNPNHKMCAVTNTDGLDVCTICKATYLTTVKLDDGRIVSLMAKKLPPPYVTFAVVTQHEARSRSTTLTNTRFQLSFANIPRGQQFLTIGRSTTNNMTLRYRTVSQLHAKVKFEDNNFYLYDASSSNGTMLFLSKPVELDWNKTVHVKIGRTILTLKSKKRWKWSGGAEMDDEALASPRRETYENNNQLGADEMGGLAGQRFDSHPSSMALFDPSAELLSSPYSAASIRQRLNRTFALPQSLESHQYNHTDHDDFRLTDILHDGNMLGTPRGPDSSSENDEPGSQRHSLGTPREYPDLPASAVAGSSIPRLSSRFMDRRDDPAAVTTSAASLRERLERVRRETTVASSPLAERIHRVRLGRDQPPSISTSTDLSERLQRVLLSDSPSPVTRLSAPARFEHS